MDGIALLARFLLAAIFVVAAVGKLADSGGSRQAVMEFGVPKRVARRVAAVLPLVEIAIAALLISSASTRWGALGALGLLGLFTTGITISLARGRRPNCHCFGQLHSSPVGWSTVFRNGCLATVAALVLWRGGENSNIVSFAASADFSPATWIVLVVALVGLAVATIEAWFLLKLLPQQGRILVRLEAVEAALALDRGTGLPIGQEAPDFDLRSVAGDRVTLATLRSSGQPLLLLFTNPDCAPCDAVLPDIARWQREHGDRVTIAVMSHGSMEVNHEKARAHGLQMFLLQNDREVTKAYQIDSTPAAVLLNPEGRVASSIGYGAEHIERLLQQAVDGRLNSRLELMPPDTGARGQSTDPTALLMGQPAPSFVLPDLKGKMTDLADFHGASTLVLFWNPACRFCQHLLPELKTWERKRFPSPHLLMVSTGTVEANQAMGLASRIVLDADGSTMSRFGASGTPMGVLVDATGRIASSLAAGAQQVMALAWAQDTELVSR